MPMTINDWDAWSLEKRTFYVTLFTRYFITDDGVLCSDLKQRRSHVRMQLDRQLKMGAEQILTSSFLANYVLIDGLELDGKTLKKSEAIDSIKVLSLTRRDTIKDPSQNVLLGGFKLPGHDIREHFKQVLRDKMCDGADVEAKVIADTAKLLPLEVNNEESNDLTFFSRCAPHLDELKFLLGDPLFKAAIQREATRLSEIMVARKLSVETLRQQIISDIKQCSDDVTNQRSLMSLSVPRIQTFLALYTTPRFKVIEKYAKGIRSKREKVVFQTQSGSLSHYLGDGLLAFGSLSDIRSLLHVLFKLGAASATEILKAITIKQIENLKKGILPILLLDMNTTWVVHRTPEELLQIMREMQSINLYAIAEIVGFSNENAHVAFGLASRAVVDEVNSLINKCWDDDSEELLRGAGLCIKKTLFDSAPIMIPQLKSLTIPVNHGTSPGGSLFSLSKRPKEQSSDITASEVSASAIMSS